MQHFRGRCNGKSQLSYCCSFDTYRCATLTSDTILETKACLTHSVRRRNTQRLPSESWAHMAAPPDVGFARRPCYRKSREASPNKSGDLRHHSSRCRQPSQPWSRRQSCSRLPPLPWLISHAEACRVWVALLAENNRLWEASEEGFRSVEGVIHEA